MIKTFLNQIKKIFAIIFSFIFNCIFKNNKTKNHSKKQKQVDEESKLKVDRGKKSINFKPSEEKPSKTDHYFYVKQDLQRIFNIVKKIEKIELELRNVTDKESLEVIKKEIDRVKDDLKFLENKYRNLEVDNIQVQEVKSKIIICTNLVEVTERKTKEIIIDKQSNKKSNDKIEKKLFKEIIKSKEEEKLNDSLNRKENRQNTVLEKEKPFLMETKNIHKDKKASSAKKTPENILKTNQDHQAKETKNMFLASIIIKEIIDDIPEIKQKPNKSSQTEVDKIKEKTERPNKKKHDQNYNQRKKQEILSKDKTSKDKSTKKIQMVLKSNIRTYSIDLNLLKQRISNLKNQSKLQKISSSVKKALKLTTTLGLLVFAKNSKSKLLATNLMINNHIRKARRINNRRIKPLKYEKVLRSVSNKSSVNIQIDYIMKNTLKQINELRQEIYSQYQMNDEIMKLLEELNEIELNIRNSLEQRKNKQEENSKIR